WAWWRSTATGKPRAAPTTSGVRRRWLRPSDFADGEVVAIAGRRCVVDRHGRAARGYRVGGPLHPIRIANRRRVLVDRRLTRADGVRGRTVVVVADAEHQGVAARRDERGRWRSRCAVGA